MKTEHKLQLTQIHNQLLEIQIKIMESKELIFEIDGILETFTNTTFHMMNSIAEMKETSKSIMETTKEFKNGK